MLYRYEGQITVDQQVKAKVSIPGEGEILEIPTGLIPPAASPGDLVEITTELAGGEKISMFIDRIEATELKPPASRLAVCYFPQSPGHNQLLLPAALIERAKEGRWYRVKFTFDQEKTKQEKQRVKELQDELIEQP